MNGSRDGSVSYHFTIELFWFIALYNPHLRYELFSQLKWCVGGSPVSNDCLQMITWPMINERQCSHLGKLLCGVIKLDRLSTCYSGLWYFTSVKELPPVTKNSNWVDVRLDFGNSSLHLESSWSHHIHPSIIITLCSSTRCRNWQLSNCWVTPSIYRAEDAMWSSQ